MKIKLTHENTTIEIEAESITISSATAPHPFEGAPQATTNTPIPSPAAREEPGLEAPAASETPATQSTSRATRTRPAPSTASVSKPVASRRPARRGVKARNLYTCDTWPGQTFTTETAAQKVGCSPSGITWGVKNQRPVKGHTFRLLTPGTDQPHLPPSPKPSPFTPDPHEAKPKTRPLNADVIMPHNPNRIGG